MKQLLIAFFFCVLLIKTEFSVAYTIHVVLVGATLDSKIGLSTERSLELIKRKFQLVSDALKGEASVRYYELMGKDCNRKSVVKLLQSVKSQTEVDDVVFFYSSTHGFRFSDTKSKYPFLWLNPTSAEPESYEDIAKSSFPLELISNYFRGAETSTELGEGDNIRLSIVLGEACNTDIGIESPMELLDGLYPRKFDMKKDYFSKLFSQRGYIVASSSVPERPSYGSGSFGGYFLNAFYNSMDPDKFSEPNWVEILNRTVMFTSLIWKEVDKSIKIKADEWYEQVPQFDTDFTPGGSNVKFKPNKSK